MVICKSLALSVHARHVIVGIDAAWTAKNPSSVAVLQFEKQQPPSLALLGRSHVEKAH